MRLSRFAIRLLFDYDDMSPAQRNSLIKKLPPKQLRLLASIHPDNRVRVLLLKSTGVDIGIDSVVNLGITISDDYKQLLTLGSRVSIGPNVTFLCTSSPNNSHYLSRIDFLVNFVSEDTIIVEDDAWIGANVVILPGVVVGSGAIVGAGSIVTKSIEPGNVYAGNPAKFLRVVE